MPISQEHFFQSLKCGSVMWVGWKAWSGLVFEGMQHWFCTCESHPHLVEFSSYTLISLQSHTGCTAHTSQPWTIHGNFFCFSNISCNLRTCSTEVNGMYQYMMCNEWDFQPMGIIKYYPLKLDFIDLPDIVRWILTLNIYCIQNCTWYTHSPSDNLSAKASYQ